MQVDLREPDQNIAPFIAKQCAAFGKVVSVKIFRSPSPFALVEMGNLMQTLELAGKFGGSTVGRAALIHLEPKPQK